MYSHPLFTSPPGEMQIMVVFFPSNVIGNIIVIVICQGNRKISPYLFHTFTYIYTTKPTSRKSTIITITFTFTHTETLVKSRLKTVNTHLIRLHGLNKPIFYLIWPTIRLVSIQSKIWSGSIRIESYLIRPKFPDSTKNLIRSKMYDLTENLIRPNRLD